MFICDICDRECKNKSGLVAHRRWHDLPENKEFQENFRKNQSKALSGRNFSEEHKRKLSEIAKKRSGRNSPMYGKYHSEETKKKMSEAHKGDKNYGWKGDGAGSSAIHNWIRKNKPKPLNCEICGLSGKLELSNKTGKLIRDVDNFQWVHHKCHFRYDHENKNLPHNIVPLI